MPTVSGVKGKFRYAWDDTFPYQLIIRCDACKISSTMRFIAKEDVYRAIEEKIRTHKCVATKQ